MDRVRQLGVEFFNGLRDEVEVTVTVRIPVQDKWQFAAGDALRKIADTIYMHPSASMGRCDDMDERYRANFHVKGN